MRQIWIAGNLPAPQWLQEQDAWFVHLELDGTTYFQGVRETDGAPVAVMVPYGEKVELREGKWRFDGNEVKL